MQPVTRHPLQGRFSLDTATGSFLGDTRIRLLEAIDEYGSISQAAKSIPLSYKAAWDAVDAMNNLAAEPLMVRTTGGKHGGGTELTPYGRRLIAFYRALEQEYQAAIDRVGDRLLSELGGDGPNDIAGFRNMLSRMAMKSSARNQFAGPVETLSMGEVDCEVGIRLGDDLSLVAIITRESAETLGLAVGREVQALVKSSSILLAVGDDLRLSARNRFIGEVVRLHEGAVNAEVTLTLPGERHLLTAVITVESLREMGLAIGSQVCAAFKAASVILTVGA